MSDFKPTQWPGDQMIAKKKRNSPWQYMLFSLGCLALAGGLVAANLYMPTGSTIRMPWVFAIVFNLLGPIGILVLLVLLALISFVIGIRAFFQK